MMFGFKYLRSALLVGLCVVGSSLGANDSDVSPEDVGLDKTLDISIKKKIQTELLSELGTNARGLERQFDIIVFLKQPAQSRGANPFDGGESEAAHRESIKEAQYNVLGGAARPGSGVSSSDVIEGLQVEYLSTSIYSFQAIATEAAIQRLAAHDDVTSIVQNPVFERFDVNAHGLTGADVAHSAGFTGEGVVIAVIDDGIDHDHAAFGGESAWPNSKIIGGYDAADNDSNPTIDCLAQGHGTGVSGVAAGNGGGVTGSAPDAKLVFVKVQGAANCGARSLTNIFNALDWVVSNRVQFGIDVVNMSFGGGSFSSICDSANQSYAQYFNSLDSAGVISVAASGNDYQTNSISRPACFSNVISVGAVFDKDGGNEGICGSNSGEEDTVICYSNSSSILDLLAPSACATTAATDGGIRSCFNGTSSASPYAAGVVALMLSQNPGMSRQAVLSQLKATGRQITDSKSGVVTSRVQVDSALDVRMPEMQTPPDGTVIIGGSSIFVWSGNGANVLAYELTAGSSPGASDYFSSGNLGLSNSVTVSGLPTSGETIFVTLWFRTSAGWSSIPYIYLSGSSVDQYEPDDSFSSASVIEPAITKSHSLSPVGDVDHSVFTLTSTVEVTITTSGDSGDTVLSLHNSQGSLIAENDDSTDSSGNTTLFSKIVLPLSPGTYYTRVTEYNNDDSIPEYSLDLRVVSNGQRPSKPELVYPTGFDVVEGEIFLNWLSQTNATSYRLWVRDSNGTVVVNESLDSEAVSCEGGVSSCVYVIDSELPPGSTAWYVRASNAFGNSPWSNPAVFEVAGATTPPGKPALIGPVNNVSTSVPFSFSWLAESVAAYYTLWVRDSTGTVVMNQRFSALQLGCAAGVDVCSYEYTDDLPPGRTNWYVQAENSVGKSPWSSAGVFEIEGDAVTPQKPTLIGPINGITTSVPFTFSWLSDPDATHFRLWIRNSAGTIVLNQLFPIAQLDCASGQELCDYRYTDALPAGRTNWYVQGENSGLKGPWSSAGVVYVQDDSAPPGKVVLTSPIGTTESAPVQFTWESESAATDYRLWIRNSAGTVVLNELLASSAVGCESSAQCGYTFGDGLTAGNTAWYVQAQSSAGKGPWSAAGVFEIEDEVDVPSVPVPMDPVGASWSYPGDFTWTAEASATRYQIVVRYGDGSQVSRWYDEDEFSCYYDEVFEADVCFVSGFESEVGGRWWVRALNETGLSSWSSTTTFSAATGASALRSR